VQPLLELCKLYLIDGDGRLESVPLTLRTFDRFFRAAMIQFELGDTRQVVGGRGFEMLTAFLEPLLEVCPLARMVIRAVVRQLLKLGELDLEGRRFARVKRNLFFVLTRGVQHCLFQMAVSADVVERAERRHATTHG
jgi:hypothetical protein